MHVPIDNVGRVLRILLHTTHLSMCGSQLYDTSITTKRKTGNENHGEGAALCSAEIMYRQSSECHEPISFHCAKALEFSFWVSPYSLESFLRVMFWGFGRHKDAKILWKCTCKWHLDWKFFLYLFFGIGFSFIASLWAFVKGAFWDVAISNAQRDWQPVLL